MFCPLMIMDCLYSSCTVSNALERSITCWLCEGHAHLRCAGLNGRHFDKIVDRSNGLRWSCLKCRGMDVDFYRLFSEAKKGFSDINKDISAMVDKFRKFEVMFNEFKWPDDLVASPKRKRPSAPLIRDHVALSMPLTPNIPELVLPPSGGLPVLGGVVGLAPDDQVPGVGQVSERPVGSLLGATSSLECPLDFVYPSVVVGHVDGNDDGGCGSALGGNSLSSGYPFDRTRGGSSLGATGDGGLPGQPGCGLVVVPPRRMVFVSRLSCDTSVDSIAAFLRSRCEGFCDDDCSIFKFNYSRPRDISSFRILVPLRLFEIIVEESFWPPGVLVREFVPREGPRRGRVVNMPHVSKN